jgi:anthranilate synthase component 1
MSDSGRVVLHARRHSVRTHATADTLLERIPGVGHRMLVDAVPVDGSRKPVVAVGSVLTFEATGDRHTCVDGDGRPAVLTAGRDPLSQLWSAVRARVCSDGPAIAAPLRSMFGFMSYEAARGFERLPGRHPRLVPDYLFFWPRVCVALGDGTAEVVGYGRDGDEAARAVKETVAAIEAGPATSPVVGPDGPESAPRVREVSTSLSPAGYAEAVGRAKRYLRDGDIFQVVLALHQRLAVRVDPLWLYRRLTRVARAPFQFCYRGPEFAAVGMSPEPFVTVTGDLARLRPLAGTRPRGATAEADRAMEHELRTSEKELAEHRMLVDLARNDLGRVCRPGTVEVDELLHVERYAQVMHLESNVVGRLAGSTPREAVLRSAFPAGTMTGAPKVRAMEIVDELEPRARGLYAGLVGLLAADEIHTYLTIRSAHLTDDDVTLSAGAGIVYDSEPDAEYAECLAAAHRRQRADRGMRQSR